MRNSRRLLLAATVGAAVLAGAVTIASAAWMQTAAGGPLAISAATLAAPTNLTVQKSVCDTHNYFTLRFTWDASNPSADITGYTIAQGPTVTGPWTDQYTTSAGTGPQTFTSPYPPGRTDWQSVSYYSVRATASTWSSAVTVSAQYTAPKSANCSGG